MKVRNILARKGTYVATMGPEHSVREGIAELVSKNIGALIIVDLAGRPLGIVSERDIIRFAAANEAVFDLKLGEIMTSDLITALPQDDVISVAHTMTEKRIRHLPVLENGELVGIVSIGDVVKAQRDQYRGEVDTLQIQLSNGA